MAEPPASLRCLVVDDDPLAVQIVENCLANTPFLTHVGSYTSALAAAEYLHEQPIDLLFLDVEMPFMSGLELLRTLRQPPLVVLITSKKGYAVEAFEYAVLDYLVKPISYVRFLQAAEKARELVAARSEVPEAANSTFTFVKVDSKLVKVQFDEVLFVEALGDYVHLVTKQRKLIVYSTLRAIEEKFPAALFMRVHRSFVVNIRQIQTIEDNSIFMADKYVPIGQTYQKEVLQRLNRF